MDDLLRRFTAMRPKRSDKERAPHKPLLALWAIGRCLRHKPREVSFAEADRAVTGLLAQFGPHRGKAHPAQYPFWHMRIDQGIWEVHGKVREGSSGHAWLRDLRQPGVTGGLPAAVYEKLAADTALAWRIAQNLVSLHFPPTLRAAVLRATLPTPATEADLPDWRLPAYPGFQERVLAAYEGRCAVCAFTLRRGGRHFGVAAAHIKWREMQGPNDVRNGIALCGTHRALFDLGAFTLRANLEVVVASTPAGERLHDALGRHAHQPLLVLPEADAWPDRVALRWHASEVFQEPARAA